MRPRAPRQAVRRRGMQSHRPKVDRVRFELTTAGESTPSAYHSRGSRRPGPSAYLWRFQRPFRERTTLFALRLSVTRSITAAELSPVFSQTELPAQIAACGVEPPHTDVSLCGIR